MDSSHLAKQIIATYQRHGWQLKRALLSQSTRAELGENVDELFKGACLIDSDIDAFWFARPSPAQREAWELRLLAEQPYALFAAFEAEESEADRQEARREMENRVRSYVARD